MEASVGTIAIILGGIWSIVAVVVGIWYLIALFKADWIIALLSLLATCIPITLLLYRLARDRQRHYRDQPGAPRHPVRYAAGVAEAAAPVRGAARRGWRD